jgi:hypothetical protein
VKAKGATPHGAAPFESARIGLDAAAGVGPAAAASRIELDIAGQSKSVVDEIDLYGLSNFDEFFVDDIGETVDIVHVI